MIIGMFSCLKLTNPKYAGGAMLVSFSFFIAGEWEGDSEQSYLVLIGSAPEDTDSLVCPIPASSAVVIQ